ncbi:MAG: hypothetical protein IKD40_01155 [Bacteroidaceae bacterium]|nr:hypothetical protein [Bacteroidaceae bacterium]
MGNTYQTQLLTFNEQTIREIYLYALKFTDNSEAALRLTECSLPYIVDYYNITDGIIRSQLRQHAKQVVWTLFLRTNDSYLFGTHV